MSDEPSRLTQVTKLSPELEAALPVHRKEKKVKDSALGALFMLVGLGVIGLAGYIAYSHQKDPNLILIGGIGAFGAAFMCIGGIVADKETFLPALRGFADLVFEYLKLKKAS